MKARMMMPKITIANLLRRRGAALLAVALVLILASRDGRQTPAVAREVRPLTAPTGASRHPIDRALSAGAKFLADRQAKDGVWRSDVYGPFKQGDALTPLVLLALLESPYAHDHRLAIDEATQYLMDLAPDDTARHTPRPNLTYPIYAASLAAIDLTRNRDANRNTAREAWLRFIRGRQLVRPMGWQPDDSRYGGWGYSGELPTKPADGQPLAPLAEPNLSATVHALAALRAAGVASDAAEVQDARAFVERCQNFAAEGTLTDAAFDDGGFFFVAGDPVRNKAGARGHDSSGTERFASYGSATADGLRSLLLCGLPFEHPRVAAACSWMEKNFAADSHPGAYPPEREGVRNAPYFYYCHSLAQALADPAFQHSVADANRNRWAQSIAASLVRQQQPDGSWTNAAVDLREDDPLVATAFATSALAICRRLLAK